MGYDPATEEHIKSVNKLIDQEFKPKRVKSQLEDLKKEFVKRLKRCNEDLVEGKIGAEKARLEQRTLIEQFISAQIKEACKLVLASHLILTSKLASDSALNMDLRDSLEAWLSREVIDSLEVMNASLGKEVDRYKHEDLGSNIEMLRAQIGETIKFIEEYFKKLKKQDWDATKEIQNAANNFKTTADMLEQLLKPLPEHIKDDVKNFRRQVLSQMGRF